MENVVKKYLEELKSGRRQSYKNLTVFPLLSAYSSTLEYLLLDEAIRLGLLTVSEVSDLGSVPELKVINKSLFMVLILDGEELVGAKQNRIVNTTILIQGNTKIIIPVSCVEQGRWSYKSANFFSESRVLAPEIRARKAQQVNYSVRSTGQFEADQGAIWESIAEKAHRRAAHSPTGAMAEIYEKERPSIEEYAGHFSLIDSQVGAIFMINDKIAGLDAFGRPETFSKVFRKLLESYALDAIDSYEPEREYKNLRSRASEFLMASLDAETESQESVGLGTDVRMESRKVTGFALALGDQLLHISVFTRVDGAEKNPGSRMQSFSRRRRNRGV